MPAVREAFKDILVHEFAQDVSEFVQQAIAWEEAKQDVPTWVEQNRYILGEPWSYASTGPKIEWGQFDIRHKKLPRPYLLQFVRDQAPERSVIKNRQSELTENHINEALYYCLTRPHTRVGHIFPTLELSHAISAEKVLPAIEESPEILKQLKGVGAVRRYPFRNGSMYTLNGALSRAGGRAASRDILIFDEVDSMPESIFGIYEELLSHSAMRLIRKISTPTVPQVGIDRIVRQGCEYEWWVTCSKCKKMQVFTYPENLINYFELSQYDRDDPRYLKRLDKVYIGCKFCKEYIDRGGKQYLKTSRWIPKKPELSQVHASYHINVFMIPWKTGKEITRRMHELVNYSWQGHNEVIGVAYIKSEQRLAEHEIRGCERPWKMIHARVAAMSNVSVGIDWGEKQSWLVVSASGVEASNPNKRCVVYVEEINAESLKRNGFGGGTEDHVKRAKQVCDLFGADVIVSDANGLGVDRTAYLIKWYPKRAWGCFFDTAEEGRQIRKSKLLEPQFQENQRRVTISKVNTWKEIQGEFRRGVIGFASSMDDIGIMTKFIKHQMSLGVQPRWSTEYEREFEAVVKFSDQDHLADSHQYSKIGWDKLTGNRFQHTPGVITPSGIPGRSTRNIGV